MPDVVLTFTDHEKWKFYFQTQGATTRSLVAFRRARPFPGGQVKEYLTYRFTMSSMPTFGVACGVTVSKIVHPEVTHTFTVVCLLVDNILENKKYYVVPDEGDVERAKSKYEFAKYEMEKAWKFMEMCELNYENNIEDSNHYERDEDRPDPPADGFEPINGFEDEYQYAGQRDQTIDERLYFQNQAKAWKRATECARQKYVRLHERCFNWYNHWQQTLRAYRDGCPPGSASLCKRKRYCYDALIPVRRRSFHAKILAIRKDAILP
jgi:hypothetical protein